MAASVSRAFYVEIGRTAARMGYPFPGHDQPCQVSGQRLPLVVLLQRLEELERWSGDESIGLRIGRLLGPGALGVPGYLAMAGPTLLDALPRVMSFQRLVADGIAIRWAVDGPAVRFRVEYDGTPAAPALSDLVIAGTRFFGAWLLGHEPSLSDVWFRRPPPASTELHTTIFGCVRRFGCRDDGFSVERRWFDETLRTAETSVVAILVAQATRLLAGLRADGFVAAVSSAIVELIGAGEPVEMVGAAARVHTSPRTLQRRLQAHGTTFNRLLQELRMDMAQRFLADESLSLHQIALLLGYTEQSSFCHAYRQWTGRSPSEARRDMFGGCATRRAPSGRHGGRAQHAE